MTRSVEIRELKHRLSEYLRAASRGDRVLVTDRGRVVAELGPPLHGARESHPHPGLVELAGTGGATLGSGNHASLYPALCPVGNGALAESLLDDER